MKITIHDDFLRKDIAIDIDKRDKAVNCPHGSLVCNVHPIFGLPLRLEIGITPEGAIVHRGYEWDDSRGNGNTYLHTVEHLQSIWGPVTPTPAMAETLAGLFSGRILIDGIKIAVGASPQRFCPLDLAAEEKRIDAKIFLA